MVYQVAQKSKVDDISFLAERIINGLDPAKNYVVQGEFETYAEAQAFLAYMDGIADMIIDKLGSVSFYNFIIRV